MSSEKKVVLTCAQPTGFLHLGNYLGAVSHWTSMLDNYQCFFGIVDQHAITVPYTPADLRKSSLTCLAQYIACGLDPNRCKLFLQSHVTGHTELAWILGCLCPLGRLERMTQFKDKAKGEGDSAGAGLLFYPVLMAADILLYNADVVPVGEDQKQHLELTRDLAQKFNHTYSDTFTIPEPSVPKTGARVMSLQNPEAKMSKSDPSQLGTVYLVDEPDVLRKKFKSAVTDSGSEIKAGKDKPGVTNLLNIMSLATDRAITELEGDFVGKGYGEFKESVAEAVIEMLKPIREKYKELEGQKDYLQGVLKEGAETAQKRAYKMLAKVYKKTGFLERARS